MDEDMDFEDEEVPRLKIYSELEVPVSGGRSRKRSEETVDKDTFIQLVIALKK
jgi:hypothetical protein